MKKTVSMLCCLIILASVLAACAPAPAPTAAAPAAAAQPTPEKVVVKETVVVQPTAEPQGPVTLTFWHAYNETSAENKMLTETLIPMFEKAHPNIKIQSLSVPYEDFRRKLITSISGGVAPDLIRSDIIWVPELADMGALVPLDEKMSDFGDIKTKVFPGPLSTTLWKDHYYGLPLDTNTKVWLYNKELYDLAGIKAPAKNISELADQCKALKAAKKDAYLFATDGTFAWAVLPWIWSMGGDVLDPQMTKATGYLNSPKTVAAYELWLKLYSDGCIAPVVLGNGVDVWTGFAQDQYANLDNGPWTYPIIQGQFPDKKIYEAPFPAGEAGSIDVVGGEDVIMFQQSQHPAEAMEFIRFLLSSDYQLKMAETGQIPVLLDAANSDYMKNHAYYPAFMEQLKTARARPSHPSWSKMDEIITEAGQLILRKEMTPQAALDQAAAKIDALLK
jgi:multiple sugar transport system substrate-binding protein